MNKETARSSLSRTRVAVFATACGITVANLYYAQPMVHTIGQSLAMPDTLSGLVVTVTQIGYAAGLILLVSLADLMENRRLVILALLANALALLAMAVAPAAALFFLAVFGVGFFSAATQVLVPFAAHLVPEAQRGRVVGNVMGGLLLGIMLSRPLSTLLAGWFGWQVIFWLSALLMAILAVMLRLLLPARQPKHNSNYYAILGSLWHLFRHTPLLRRRALWQGLLFAVFNLFWTATPMVLAGPRFQLSAHEIALFLLAGAAGALAAPIAGRLADKGLTGPATLAAMLMVALAFAATFAAWSWHSVTLFVIAAIVLDAGVQTHQVLSLRAIYTLPAEARGRLNGLFMTSVFLCGSSGALLAGALFAHWGWPAVAVAGCVISVLALFSFASRASWHAEEA
ncbi:MFS transporter [Martelella alba]|uniref:MFS transporter n=1 Tax=Martelella alba TaxID=2590451 RepID=A0ABY2SM65_9HYPH|nr:MFS transporter [Martelella alba]TKI06341.1 MFS transporter [Martelella alba]